LADCSHSQAKNQCCLFAASTPRKPLLDQFISSYGSNDEWFYMLLCYKVSVWVILDMSCPVGTVAGKKFGRFQPELSQKQPCLQPAHQANHCWTFSLPPYGSNEWFYMLPCYKGSVRVILDMSCPLGTVAGQKFGRKPTCLQPAHQGNHCWSIHFLHMGPMTDDTGDILLTGRYIL
jgi:hypothetical protein